MVTVVQLVRASDCGSECRGFESHQSPEEILSNQKIAEDFSFIINIITFALNIHHYLSMKTYSINYKKAFCLCIALITTIHSIFAQVEKDVYTSNYLLDATKEKTLNLEIENLNFFQNNEYGGGVMKGYTLPGLWITPKLTYQPTSNLKLEAGIHALLYHGAYKFPNYAYTDIPKWKGNQYQKGAHLLPHFSAQLALGNVNFILGSLHGASNHNLITPLYDPELTLTADPEMGFQILFDKPRFHLDVWVNWQSFIFDIDSHQEAFIVGLNTKYNFHKGESPWHGYLHLQGIIQHRGGEQDNTGEVNTLMNGAFGGGVTRKFEHKFFNSLNLEANFLGYFQQAGNLWPFNKGAGFYASTKLQMIKRLYLQAGYFVGHQFISILGLPYFGAVSTANGEGVFNDYPKTLHLAIDYSHAFSHQYAAGVKFSIYHATPGKRTLANGNIETPTSSTNFAIGVYLKTDFAFLLKKFN